MDSVLSRFRDLSKNSELAIAVGLLLVLAVMVVPMSDISNMNEPNPREATK